MTTIRRFATAVAVVAIAVAAAAPRAQAPQIRVVLLGTAGGPNPGVDRAGAAALIEAGSERFLIDTGRNVSQQLLRAGSSPAAVTRAFLTHLHSDHVLGLDELWLSGWWMFRNQRLEVRGPVGTRAMAQHLSQAFAFDVDVRVGPPEKLNRDDAALVGIDVAEGVVHEANGVRVTAITVDHGPVPTFGYRIDYAGRSVVFSGDDRRSENLIKQSQNCDVMFHNMSMFTEEQLRFDRPKAAVQLLASPEDAAAVFSQSRCRVATLIHSPTGANARQRVRDAGYKGRLEAPDDLTEILVGDEVIVRPVKR